MSHITEISISGLAGRDGTYTQKLNRDVNVFFGLNGSGKTSLLKIMHSAMAGDASILHSVPFTRAEVTFYSVHFEAVYTRRIVKAKVETQAKASDSLVTDPTTYLERGWDTPKKPSSAFQWKVSPALPGGAMERFAHEYLPTSRLYLGSGLAAAASIARGQSPGYSEEEALDQDFATSLERLWTSYSASVLSQVNRAQQDGLASILRAVLSPSTTRVKSSENISSETAYERVAAFLKRQGSPTRLIGSFDQFKKRFERDPKLRSVVRNINAVEQGIEKAMTPRNELQTLIEEMFGDTKVIFNDQDIEVIARGNTTISLRGLSSGQKHVLRLFIETLKVGFSSLMIDEPEISMHVDWQKRLVKSMRKLNPAAQLILATHSPEIMADIPDDRIFRL